MILEQLAQFLRGTDEVRFTLKRGAGDLVEMVLTPVLGPEPEGLTDELRQLRAAIARGVVIRDQKEGLDGRMADFLKKSSPLHVDAAFSYETALAQQAAANAKAKGKAAEKAKAAAEAKEVKGEAKKTEAPAATGGSDDLFGDEK